MSNEELVAEIRQGKADLMGQLWEQVRAFVYYRARAALLHIPAGCGVTLEDLAQSGYLALVSAVESYDEGKCAFITWFGWHLKNEFAAAGGYRSSKRDPLLHAVSLDAPLGAGDSAEDGTLMDIVESEQADGRDDYADIEDEIYREQLHDVLDRTLDKLPPLQADVLRGRYWEGKGSLELAEERGISAAQLRRYESAGLYALRSPSVAYELTQFLDDNTDYYHNGGLSQFRATGSSSVENTVVRREELERRWRRQYKKPG